MFVKEFGEDNIHNLALLNSALINLRSSTQYLSEHSDYLSSDL